MLIGILVHGFLGAIAGGALLAGIGFFKILPGLERRARSKSALFLVRVLYVFSLLSLIAVDIGVEVTIRHFFSPETIFNSLTLILSAISTILFGLRRSVKSP